MSLLNSLNPLSMVSNAVESAFDAVLPKELEFIGDAAGLLTDFQTGNYLKCFEDAQDLFKDLPQQLGEMGKRSGAGGTLRPRVASDLFASPLGHLEPLPPPPYGAAPPDVAGNDDLHTTGLKTSSKRPVSGTAKLQRTTTFAVPPTVGEPRGRAATPVSGSSIAATVVHGTPSAHTASKPVKTTKPDQATKPAKTTKPDQATKPAKTTKPEQATQPAKTTETTESAAEPSMAEDSSTIATKASEGKKPAPTQASKSMSPDAFFKLSDKALMDAVRNGNIPESVKGDPEQMRRLQVRMEDISQMNSIITTMLNTMHEMNKAIIQNLRV